MLVLAPTVAPTEPATEPATEAASAVAMATPTAVPIATATPVEMPKPSRSTSAGVRASSPVMGAPATSTCQVSVQKVNAHLAQH